MSSRVRFSRLRSLALIAALVWAAPSLAEEEAQRPTLQEFTDDKEKRGEPENPHFKIDPLRLAKKMSFETGQDQYRSWAYVSIGSCTAVLSSVAYLRAHLPLKESDEGGARVISTVGLTAHGATMTLFSIGLWHAVFGNDHAREAIVALGGPEPGLARQRIAVVLWSLGLGVSVVPFSAFYRGGDPHAALRRAFYGQIGSLALMVLATAFIQVDFASNRSRLNNLIAERVMKPTASKPKFDATLTVMATNETMGLAVVGRW